MNLSTNAAVSVLLIDDDVELVRLLAQLFTREGIALRSATTGAAGLDGLNPAPSLVLLDLMLPDMHGKDVFRRLRERLPELPVIMLTAKGDPVDRVIGLELGADDYVPNLSTRGTDRTSAPVCVVHAQHRRLAQRRRPRLLPLTDPLDTRAHVERGLCRVVGSGTADQHRVSPAVGARQASRCCAVARITDARGAGRELSPARPRR